MRRNCVVTLSLAVLALYSAAPLDAATINDFEGGGGTPATFEAFGDPNPPAIDPAGGIPGGALVLTQAVNNLHNWATFDNSDAGTFPISTFGFDFNISIGAVPSADGFSFSYADTATYGTAGGVGAAPFTAEDPAAAGILGFGFDTWSNQGMHDNPDVPTGSDYQEISVFWDGAVVARIDDTRTLPTPLLLDDAQWHRANGTVNFEDGTVSLTVDGQSIFDDLEIPGLVPYESRIMFAARTGGENERVAIDNLNVAYLTEIIFGDANGDMAVDLLDYNIIRDNLHTGRTLMTGDVNFDGITNLADFIVWKQAHDGGNGAIPEPGTFLMFSTSCVLLLFIRRRRA